MLSTERSISSAQVSGGSLDGPAVVFLVSAANPTTAHAAPPLTSIGKAARLKSCPYPTSLLSAFFYASLHHSNDIDSHTMASGLVDFSQPALYSTQTPPPPPPPPTNHPTNTFPHKHDPKLTSPPPIQSQQPPSSSTRPSGTSPPAANTATKPSPSSRAANPSTAATPSPSPSSPSASCATPSTSAACAASPRTPSSSPRSARVSPSPSSPAATCSCSPACGPSASRARTWATTSAS